MEIVAFHDAQVHYHHMLAEQFDTLANAIDPHTRWWDFAEAKQHWRRNIDDEQRHHAKRDVAERKLRALAKW